MKLINHDNTSTREWARVDQKPKGLSITLCVNCLVKPFGMALLSWLFLQKLFAPWIEPELARNSTAGLIILAAAPCNASESFSEVES